MEPRGKLRLRRTLGKGASAVVVLAQSSTGQVACKICRSAGGATQAEKDEAALNESLFHQEAELMQQLSSPNIIRCLDHGHLMASVPGLPEGCSTGASYMLLEFMEEGSLARLVLRQMTNASRLYTDYEAFSILLDVAEGLQYLHSQSPPIVHRDMKMENLLLTRQQGRLQAKIADLGLHAVLDQSMHHSLLRRRMACAPPSMPGGPPRVFYTNVNHDMFIDKPHQMQKEEVSTAVMDDSVRRADVVGEQVLTVLTPPPPPTTTTEQQQQQQQQHGQGVLTTDVTLGQDVASVAVDVSNLYDSNLELAAIRHSSDVPSLTIVPNMKDVVSDMETMDGEADDAAAPTPRLLETTTGRSTPDAATIADDAPDAPAAAADANPAVIGTSPASDIPFVPRLPPRVSSTGPNMHVAVQPTSRTSITNPRSSPSPHTPYSELSSTGSWNMWAPLPVGTLGSQNGNTTIMQAKVGMLPSSTAQAPTDQAAPPVVGYNRVFMPEEISLRVDDMRVDDMQLLPQEAPVPFAPAVVVAAAHSAHSVTFPQQLNLTPRSHQQQQQEITPISAGQQQAPQWLEKLQTEPQVAVSGTPSTMPLGYMGLVPEVQLRSISHSNTMEKGTESLDFFSHLTVSDLPIIKSTSIDDDPVTDQPPSNTSPSTTRPATSDGSTSTTPHPTASQPHTNSSASATTHSTPTPADQQPSTSHQDPATSAAVTNPMPALDTWLSASAVPTNTGTTFAPELKHTSLSDVMERTSNQNSHTTAIMDNTNRERRVHGGALAKPHVDTPVSPTPPTLPKALSFKRPPPPPLSISLDHANTSPVIIVSAHAEIEPLDLPNEVGTTTKTKGWRVLRMGRSGSDGVSNITLASPKDKTPLSTRSSSGGLGNLSSPTRPGVFAAHNSSGGGSSAMSSPNRPPAGRGLLGLPSFAHYLKIAGSGSGSGSASSSQPTSFLRASSSELPSPSGKVTQAEPRGLLSKAFIAAARVSGRKVGLEQIPGSPQTPTSASSETSNADAGPQTLLVVAAERRDTVMELPDMVSKPQFASLPQFMASGFGTSSSSGGTGGGTRGRGGSLMAHLEQEREEEEAAQAARWGRRYQNQLAGRTDSPLLRCSRSLPSHLASLAMVESPTDLPQQLGFLHSSSLGNKALWRQPVQPTLQPQQASVALAGRKSLYSFAPSSRAQSLPLTRAKSQHMTRAKSIRSTPSAPPPASTAAPTAATESIGQKLMKRVSSTMSLLTPSRSLRSSTHPQQPLLAQRPQHVVLQKKHSLLSSIPALHSWQPDMRTKVDDVVPTLAAGATAGPSTARRLSQLTRSSGLRSEGNTPRMSSHSGKGLHEQEEADELVRLLAPQPSPAYSAMHVDRRIPPPPWKDTPPHLHTTGSITFMPAASVPNSPQRLPRTQAAAASPGLPWLHSSDLAQPPLAHLNPRSPSPACSIVSSCGHSPHPSLIPLDPVEVPRGHVRPRSHANSAHNTPPRTPREALRDADGGRRLSLRTLKEFLGVSAPSMPKGSATPSRMGSPKRCERHDQQQEQESTGAELASATGAVRDTKVDVAVVGRAEPAPEIEPSSNKGGAMATAAAAPVSVASTGEKRMSVDGMVPVVGGSAQPQGGVLATVGGAGQQEVPTVMVTVAGGDQNVRRITQDKDALGSPANSGGSVASLGGALAEARRVLSPEFQWVFNLTGDTGSSMYMAPEVQSRQPYNEAVDVFSFGVVMYEVLSRSMLAFTLVGDERGRVAATADEYAEKVAKGFRPSKPVDMNKEAWALIQACWAADPIERPSMKMVVARLRQLLESCPSETTGNSCSCCRIS